MTCNCNNNIESNATICNDTPCPTCGTTSGSCGCMTGSAATGAPYYNQAEGCEESHVKVCIQNQYMTGVTIANATNMPACDGTMSLLIPGLQVVVIGSYLWNPTYGYLKIISFDFASSTIVVENECQTGNAPEGTSIPACTVFTVVDYPHGISNPCTTNAVAEGALIVCANDIMQPLAGTAIGQIPVLTDIPTQTVEFQSVDLPLKVCTELTVDLVLLPGNTGPYTFNVASTINFAADDIIQVGGRPDRFTVVTILTGFTFTAMLAPAPAGVEVILAGTAVCLAPCCEQLAFHIYNPCTWDMTVRNKLTNGGYLGAAIPNGSLANPAEFIESNVPTVTIANDKCKSMLIGIDAYYQCMLAAVLAPTMIVGIFEPKFAYTTGVIGAAPAPTPVSLFPCWKSYPMSVPNDHFYFTHHENVLVATGYEIRISSQLKLTYNNGAGLLMYYYLNTGFKYFRVNI